MSQMKYVLKGCIVLLGMLVLFAVTESNEVEAKTPTYTISPSTKPIDPSFSKYSTYNSYTKNYYTLRSYLEKLEKTKGGKLILKKGTYTITNVLYVPSNVTIQFSDGVKIVKGTNTHTSKVKASTSIFQLIRPSRAYKKAVYGKFEGEKNIQFIGKGNVTMNLKYMPGAIAIIMGHNQNVVVDNIHFVNMYGGHFIELDASKNVKIKNSSFKKSKQIVGHDKEAINLDTPDRSTKGWSQEWSKFDRQANDTVLIENNTFSGLDRAVGTHKYSDKKLHNKVTLRNNKISGMRSDSIRVMNWSNATIENNTISLPASTKANASIRGILVSGAKNPTFQNNTFRHIPRPMQFIVWKNSGAGTTKEIKNTLSAANKNALANNRVYNAQENFIRITNNGYGNYSNGEFVYFK